MKLQSNTTYTLKLNSGEELIAKVTRVGELPESITINMPVSIAPGQQGMNMIPSMFTSDPNEEVTLNMSCVTMFAPTEDSIKNKYLEATTGIKVPDKKIILQG